MPPEVGKSAVLRLSFRASGTPCSGPSRGAGRTLLIRLPRGLANLIGVKRYECVETGVSGGARQQRVGKLFGRVPPCADAPRPLRLRRDRTVPANAPSQAILFAIGTCVRYGYQAGWPVSAEMGSLRR